MFAVGLARNNYVDWSVEVDRASDWVIGGVPRASCSPTTNGSVVNWACAVLLFCSFGVLTAFCFVRAVATEPRASSVMRAINMSVLEFVRVRSLTASIDLKTNGEHHVAGSKLKTFYSSSIEIYEDNWRQQAVAVLDIFSMSLLCYSEGVRLFC